MINLANIPHKLTPSGKWEYNFGPAQWVLNEIYKDIATVFNEPLNQTIRKAQIGAARVDKLWECASPETDEEITEFYRTTDAHIYENANWHTDHPAPLQRANIASKCKGGVLIYGCGIGTEGLMALYNQNVRFVAFHDVPQSLILEFVCHRLSLNGCGYYGIDFNIISSEGKEQIAARPVTEIQKMRDRWSIVTRWDEVVKETNLYDTIVCIDVLEHLADPMAKLKEFAQLLTADGKVLIDAPFEDIGPVGHRPEHKDLNLEQMILDAGIANYEINLLRPEKYKCGGNV